MTLFKPKGFTLIELLVVIAIIGLLSTLAVVSFGNARQKSRDTKRLADIKTIQTALELYFGDNDKYPVEASAVSLTASGNNDVICASSTAGINDNATNCTAGLIYMNPVPAPITPPTGNVYSYSTDATGSTYTLNFQTEQGNMAGLQAGTAHTATPAGLQ